MMMPQSKNPTCSVPFNFNSIFSLFLLRVHLTGPEGKCQIDAAFSNLKTDGPNVPVDLPTPQSHTSIQWKLIPVGAGACSRHTNHRLCHEAEDVAFQLDNPGGDSRRSSRRLLSPVTVFKGCNASGSTHRRNTHEVARGQWRRAMSSVASVLIWTMSLVGEPSSRIVRAKCLPGWLSKRREH